MPGSAVRQRRARDDLGRDADVVGEFSVGLDELHNDSTTVSFYGAYEEAGKEGHRQGRPTPAITWGHSKDHRPDLKQLLYTLTISEDGGVPVYFTTASGNVVDDRTHCQTWDLLQSLVGRPEFLYVADCKLASSENLNHIASRGGRFVTVLPRTYKEDGVFRARLRESPSSVTWRKLYDVTSAEGELLDRLSTCVDEMVSGDGYRLLWFHSTRKAALDAATRNRRLQQASAALAELQERLSGPRTRFRQRGPVEQAVRGFWRSTKSRRGWRCESRSGRERRFARPRRDARPNAHATSSTRGRRTRSPGSCSTLR